MRLQETLADLAATTANRYDPVTVKAMQDAAAELIDQGVGKAALAVGNAAPDAVIEDDQGIPVSFRDVVAGRPTIVCFYRGGWCPYCNLELRAYQAILPEIDKADGQLIAISPERPDEIVATRDKNELTFGSYTDVQLLLADAFGISFEFPKKLIDVYLSLGIRLEDVNESGKWKLPLPATYVLDETGTIVRSDVDLNYRRRMEPADALHALKDLGRSSTRVD